MPIYVICIPTAGEVRGAVVAAVPGHPQWGEVQFVRCGVTLRPLQYQVTLSGAAVQRHFISDAARRPPWLGQHRVRRVAARPRAGAGEGKLSNSHVSNSPLTLRKAVRSRNARSCYRFEYM